MAETNPCSLPDSACDQIRARKSLPTGAMGGIAIVFLGGLTLIGLGMTFDFGRHNWLLIGFGLLAMFSVGMLKISLERAPLLQLRIFREEIAVYLNASR